MELNEFFAAHPEVAVAFSGGVDSAYLLYAAKRAAKAGEGLLRLLGLPAAV